MPTILLVGRTGDGKSTTGNTLCGQGTFEARRGLSSVIPECKCGEFQLQSANGRGGTARAKVIDSAGFGDSSLTSQEQLEYLAKFKDWAPNGLDLVLFVVSYGRWGRDLQDMMSLFFARYGDQQILLVVTKCGDDPDRALQEMQHSEEFRTWARKFRGGVVCIDNSEAPARAREELTAQILRVLDPHRFFSTQDFIERTQKRIQRLRRGLCEAPTRVLEDQVNGRATQAEVEQVLAEQERIADREAEKQRLERERERERAAADRRRREDQEHRERQRERERQARLGWGAGGAMGGAAAGLVVGGHVGALVGGLFGGLFGAGTQ